MEEEAVGKLYDGRLMRRLLAYMRPYQRAVYVSVILLLAQAALQILGPLLTKIAIDRYIVPSPSAATFPAIESLLPTGAAQGLAVIAAAYLAVVVLAFLGEFAQTYLMSWTGQRAMFDLRRELMAHLQRLDLAYYDRNPVGRLVTRVTTDVDVLNELFASGLITIIGDLTMLALVVAAMFHLSPGMTGMLLLVVPLVVLVTAIFRHSVSASYRRTRIALARINSYLGERVGGMPVVQLFNGEQRSQREFDGVNREHMDAFKAAIFAYGWFYPIVEFLGMLALALLLAYGGFRVREGDLSIGVVVAFFQYGLRFFRPIQDLSEKYNILQSAMAASERVFQLLDTEVRIHSPASAVPVPDRQAPIEFDHVWFAYKGEDWVLRDLTFRVEPGETIAVVGHTGAGKTTLTSVLLRFYDVQRGAIRLGGVDIREMDPRQLRQRFGVVLQDPHLFTGTIADNIRLGTAWIDGEEVEEAVEQVNLGPFIRSLPQRYDHPVRERGADLSTGQKQLIGFARALAHNPRYLILDEATSSVDTETEMRIRGALARLVEGRTAVIIAHRLSTIQRSDRIFVMHKGRLRETGTHQQLLAMRGIYWKLYQLQYKDEEPVASVREQEQ